MTTNQSNNYVLFCMVFAIYLLLHYDCTGASSHWKVFFYIGLEFSLERKWSCFCFGNGGASLCFVVVAHVILVAATNLCTSSTSTTHRNNHTDIDWCSDLFIIVPIGTTLTFQTIRVSMMTTRYTLILSWSSIDMCHVFRHSEQRAPSLSDSTAGCILYAFLAPRFDSLTSR